MSPPISSNQIPIINPFAGDDLQPYIFEGVPDKPREYKIKLRQAGQEMECSDGNQTVKVLPQFENWTLESGQMFQCVLKFGDGTFLNLELRVPQDVVLVSTYILRNAKDMSAFKNLGKLYFANNQARILIGNLDFEVSAREIHSTDGIIQTFGEKSVAKANQPGRHAGHIEIYTKLLTGKLLIESRGETGGDGSAGELWPDASTGLDGTNPNGISGINCSDCATTLAQRMELRGGRGTNGFREGNAGHTGGRGGNSGPVLLHVRTKLAQVLIKTLPGKGGKAGLGSLGQRGGKGGANFDLTCYNRNPGAETVMMLKAVPVPAPRSSPNATCLFSGGVAHKMTVESVEMIGKGGVAGTYYPRAESGTDCLVRGPDGHPGSDGNDIGNVIETAL